MAKSELGEKAALLGLEARKAVHATGLTEGEFSFLKGTVRRGFPVQRLTPLSDDIVAHSFDVVIVHGGLNPPGVGNKFFDIEAELLFQSMTPHQAFPYEMPMSHVSRFLTAKDGIVVIDTPTMHKPQVGEIVVVERG